MTPGTYILEETKSGTHEERRQYSEGTNGRSMGGYVTDHNTTRARETIRHNKSESYRTKYLATGSRDSVWKCGMQSDGSENVGIVWKCAEMCGSVRSRAKGWESSC